MDMQVPVGQPQPPKCIPAPQVLNQLLCLTVFRGMFKKKKKGGQVSSLVSISFA